MANVRSTLVQTVNLLLLRNSTSRPSITRCYSVFSPNYVKPIYKKNEQQDLYQTNEAVKLAHMPIKPAIASDTSSEFHDVATNQLVNYLLRKGNKILARSLVEKTFENIKILQLQRYNSESTEKKDEIELDPKVILRKAIENCTPILELRPIKKGGILYQVPAPASEARGRFLCMNWLITTAKNKDHNSRFAFVLAKELIDAANNQGRVVKKKQELHRQCEANRAYAHFRWQ